MKNILSLLQYRKSYQSGLLMAKAFRILKQRTNQALAVYNINSTDWGILGLLSDNPKGLRLSALADEMGVKAPYITRSVSELTQQKLVQVTEDPTDTRARLAVLTPKGKEFVAKVEPELISKLKGVFGKLGKRDVLGYGATLVAIVEGNKKLLEGSPNLDHLED